MFTIHYQFHNSPVLWIDTAPTLRAAKAKAIAELKKDGLANYATIKRPDGRLAFAAGAGAYTDNARKEI